MPTVRTSNGVHVVATDEHHAFSVGSDYIVDEDEHRGLIFCHGLGLPEKFLAGTADAAARDCLRYPIQTAGGGSPPSRYTLLSTTQSGGSSVPDASFGNAISSDRMDDARSFLLAAGGVDTGKVALVGLSMGFLVACNYVRNVLGSSASSLIAGIVGINPGVDLSWARGRDNRRRNPASPTGNTTGTSIPLGTALPSNLVDNLNGLGPEPANQRGNYDLVESLKGIGDVTRRWAITSATTTSLTLASPGVATPGLPLSADTIEYSIRPQNDPATGLSSSAGDDFGNLWGPVGAAYNPDYLDVDYDANVNPDRNPMAFASSDPLFEVPCHLFYNPNDEIIPADRVVALEDLWNTDNPSNCVATSSADAGALHRNWKLTGSTLHGYLEGFSW